ncbi:tyrosine-type recombinase/integrase [Streptomyces sp. NR30]|uniref:Tyrosine-type recombinase/integrase n=1 Tax=Streptomyces guryensis TaxID=2886947 RepID=A0A9Q3VYK6_9ACTN|nr:tyrosine-type recombinase/integrase [Streptomyces guryensis]
MRTRTSPEPRRKPDSLSTGHGRPVNASRIEAAVHQRRRTAGLGRVTRHQLRHTLTTRAIHGGDSLEAIAALLGHRSLSMTRAHARSADRTVTDEYVAIPEKVDALYDAPRHRPTDADGGPHQGGLGSGGGCHT